MATQEQLLSMLSQIEPRKVEAFLSRSGYAQVSERDGYGLVYAAPKKPKLIVPSDNNSADYPKVLLGLLETLADAELAREDVLALMLLPPCDIFRYRIDDGTFAPSGSLSMSVMHDTVDGIYSLLRYTAAGVLSRRPSYTDVPPKAKDFVKNCRFGQTELGSFILKVFCPLDPRGSSLIDKEDSLGRTVTRACIEQFEYLNRDDYDEPSVPLPPMMNRNVAKAIAALRPESDFGSCSIYASYNPVHSTEKEHKIVELNRFVYDRADQLSRRLEEVSSEPEVLRGYVTDLHKDRPGRDVSREITLDLDYGSGTRKVSVSLVPKEYRDAIKWHDRNRRVQLDGVIDKRSAHWSVLRLISLEPVKSGQRELFEKDE